ncbi:membrane-anchored junction protein isoform X8 [Varanus komodoensis]|uniref:membrane-anchored junction protein isoform X8 n=1 Tax=Varanus komodoensis TaxID=61221 RepID=UPI001CF7B302|nr:membrane-anchored junction protein isoform X8 [Varanus komodoensis]
MLSSHTKRSVLECNRHKRTLGRGTKSSAQEPGSMGNRTPLCVPCFVRPTMCWNKINHLTAFSYFILLLAIIIVHSRQSMAAPRGMLFARHQLPRERQKDRSRENKTKNTDVYNSVNRGSKLRETVDTERAIKWGRWEDAEEISHTRVHVDRNVAKSATHDTSKSNYNRCSSARVGSDYDNRSVLGESMKTKNTENRHPEGQPPALEKRSEESMALKKKGFLESLKSTLFPPVLQQIFSGNGQPS